MYVDMHPNDSPKDKKPTSPFIFGDIFRDAPMRKRFAIPAVIGLFTQ